MPTAISTTFGFFHMARFPSLRCDAERWLRAKYVRRRNANQLRPMAEWRPTNSGHWRVTGPRRY